MSDLVQLVYFGEVIDGHAAADVKRALGQLFKLDDARAAQMFSGARVVINRAVDAADAPKHVARFARLGARLHVEPVAAAVPLSPAAAAPATATAAPLTAEEEIVCPNCGERQSKRILCRACATDMPMGIAAKIEAAQQARAEAQEARTARRGGGGGRAVASADGARVWGLGFEGRVGRLVYASAGAILIAAMVLLIVFLLKKPGLGRVAVFGLGMLAITFVSMRLSVLRCHDFNRSGWWSLLVAVPYVGAVVSLLLSLMPGSAAANDHGEPPSGGSWPVLLGSIAVLAVSVVMTGPVLMNAMMSGSLGPMAGAADSPNESAALGLMGSPARSAYLTEYARAPTHKAFAMSAGGAWGWKSGAGSQDEAVEAALATCAANRQSYTPDCVPVNVDGEWLR